MMMLSIATSFLVFSAESKSLPNSHNDTLPCGIEWCCSDFFEESDICNVTAASGSVDDDSCICECIPGYFNFIHNDTQYQTGCPNYCGEFGTAWDPLEGGCLCEEGWTNDGGLNDPCDTCDEPFALGDGECNLCTNNYDPTSYPDCNVCAEGYFKNPNFQSRSHDLEPQFREMCIPNDQCAPLLCNAGVAPTETQTKQWGDIQIIDVDGEPTCDCKCAQGYYGELITVVTGWLEMGSCQYCNGRGVSFNQTTLICTACTNGWITMSCAYCGINFAGEDCDQCAPVSDDRACGREAYPDCSHKYSCGGAGSTIGVVAIVWAVVGVVSLIFIIAVWRWDQNRRMKKEQNKTNDEEAQINFPTAA